MTDNIKSYCHQAPSYLIYIRTRITVPEFIMDTASQTGIILDPVYTGKAARGLVYELNNNPSRFKGHRILFVHTGKYGTLCNISTPIYSVVYISISYFFVPNKYNNLLIE